MATSSNRYFKPSPSACDNITLNTDSGQRTLSPTTQRKEFGNESETPSTKKKVLRKNHGEEGKKTNRPEYQEDIVPNKIKEARDILNMNTISKKDRQNVSFQLVSAKKNGDSERLERDLMKADFLRLATEKRTKAILSIDSAKLLKAKDTLQHSKKYEEFKPLSGKTSNESTRIDDSTPVTAKGTKIKVRVEKDSNKTRPGNTEFSNSRELIFFPKNNKIFQVQLTLAPTAIINILDFQVNIK